MERTGKRSKSVGRFPFAAVFGQRRRPSSIVKREQAQKLPRPMRWISRDLKGRRCVLDGEIVCLDSHVKPQFRDLLFRRAEPFFYAFDIWDEHARS